MNNRYGSKSSVSGVSSESGIIRSFPRLHPGDTIGVAAPSARFDGEKLSRGIHTLEDMGFKVTVPDGIFGQKRYLAGEDMFRAKVLNDLFADPAVQGIICARGGFGAMRVLPLLDWALIRQHPKCVAGFSDVTALLAGLMKRAGMGAVHGPNLVSLADPDPRTLDSFRRALAGEPEDIRLEKGVCLRPGTAEGHLRGGNLATLVHLLGTPFAPDFKDAVLFLEDVGEPAYKIDRMLSQMKMAGVLDGVSGVVTGSFEDCANPDYIPEILLDIFDDDAVPVLMGLEAGHGPVHLSLPMGRRAALDAARQQIRWRAIP